MNVRFFLSLTDPSELNLKKVRVQNILGHVLEFLHHVCEHMYSAKYDIMKSYLKRV